MNVFNVLLQAISSTSATYTCLSNHLPKTCFLFESHFLCCRHFLLSKFMAACSAHGGVFTLFIKNLSQLSASTNHKFVREQPKFDLSDFCPHKTIFKQHYTLSLLTISLPWYSFRFLLCLYKWYAIISTNPHTHTNTKEHINFDESKIYFMETGRSKLDFGLNDIQPNNKQRSTKRQEKKIHREMKTQ